MAKHQFSRTAYDRMQAEFDDLSTRGRFAVAEKIERAREMGDLKENGDYHAAKDEQGHMEGRIRQLEYLLENGEVIDSGPEGEVRVGQKITIVYEGDSDDMAETYIIGHVEEQLEGYDIVSPGSPLGAALLGSTVGSWVGYEAPNGELKVKILSVGPA
ncbi:MAG: transcription elongation factor GreA [Actinobacteria bacterium]|jgi:transcription elongation factor GreA|nr:transcription elongation factor GreA [Actinomycetota bacterium]